METSQPVDEIGQKERSTSREQADKRFLDLISVLPPNIDDPIFLEHHQIFLESQQPTFSYSYISLKRALDRRLERQKNPDLHRNLYADGRHEQQERIRQNIFIPQNPASKKWSEAIKNHNPKFNPPDKRFIAERQLSRIKNWHEAIKNYNQKFRNSPGRTKLECPCHPCPLCTAE